MEAPDFDELEWMAQQEFALLDALQDPPEFLQEEDEAADSHHTEISSPTAPDACRKRSMSAEPETECKSNHISLHKRGKTDDHVSIEHPLSYDMVDNDWVLPEEADWSPGRPMDRENACDAPENVNSKLPVRRLAEIEGNFMPITSPLGDRVYAEVRKVQKACNNLQSVRGAFGESKHGLLSESFEVLLEQVENNLLKQACRIAEGQDALEDFTTDSAVHERLWVEKYAPKSFTELLSDEQTNREVLKWLKQWDKCVFGEKKTSTSRDVLAALKRHAPTYQSKRVLDNTGIAVKGGLGGSENDRSGGERTDESLNHSLNSMGSITSFKNKPVEPDRPEEKILLLCGPPGLGKTTLAHVAARHCGYRVVEINASDDRVATTLQAKILDAVQMKSVMGDLRPNCVVIDEIDGALGGVDGKGAIDALLKIAYAGTKDFSGKENEKDGELVKKTLKKKTATALSRPVICICNDPYAPALRQLRQMAKVHVFYLPSVNRVVTRLKYICNLEGYKINARALTALADHTECDIRSCLNTLQFLRKREETLNTLDIASQVVGRKDMTRNAFDIWGEIFQKRKSKHGTSSGSSTTVFGKYGQEVKEFLRLHDLLANHGDFELTNDGVYDNLTHVRYHDSSLEKTVECLELLGDSEILSHHALRHQIFTLHVYRPSFALAIRRVIAQPEKPYLEWPKTFQRLRVEQSAKQELLRSWMIGMQPMTHRNFTLECLAWDLVSPLLCILAPKRLRPVAHQLLSHNEKEEINQLVDTMIAYGINYKISKLGTTSGDNFIEAHGPILEPPIHKLVQFKEYKLEHHLLSSTLRQLLSHEVELEIIRRESLARTARAMSVASELQELSLGEGPQNKHNIMIPTKSEELKQVARTSNSTRRPMDIPVERGTGEAAKPAAKAPKKAAIDVFAQFRIASVTSGKAEKNLKASSALAQRDSRPIFFKFNEGFTNAIRRPVLVRDLV